MGDAEPLVGRLGDDRRVGVPAFEQRLGADARRLLVDDGGDDHVSAQPAPRALGARTRDRREARLHVVGAAAVQTSVLDPRRQPAVRLEQPDGVEVPVQDQRPAAAAPSRDADDVRPSRSDLVDVNLEPRAFEPLREHGGDRGLAAAGGHERRVDGVDGDELRRQLRRHQSPDCLSRLGRAVERLDHARLGDRVVAAEQRLSLAGDRGRQVRELPLVRVRRRHVHLLAVDEHAAAPVRAPRRLEHERPVLSDRLQPLPLRQRERRVEDPDDVVREAQDPVEVDVDAGGADHLLAVDALRLAAEEARAADAVAADVHQRPAVEVGDHADVVVVEQRKAERRPDLAQPPDLRPPRRARAPSPPAGGGAT